MTDKGEPADLARVVSHPDLVERFEIVHELGRGGMGAVFVARDRRLDRKVALKLNLESDPQSVDRILREGRVLARLSHPNVLKVYGADVIAGVPVLVLELLEGETVAADLARSGRYSTAKALRIVSETLDGLGAAHDLGLLHRDLKPENLLMTRDETIKILDFGLARGFGLTADSRLRTITREGSILGTPAYMSPEQCRGLQLDARSDLYQVGVILFELVTGRTPFTGPGPVDIVLSQVQAAPPDPIALVPDLPPALGEIILKALSKEPDRRFADALQMRRALDEVVPGPEREPGPAAPERPSGAAPTACPGPRAGGATLIAPTARPTPRAFRATLARPTTAQRPARSSVTLAITIASLCALAACLGPCRRSPPPALPSPSLARSFAGPAPDASGTPAPTARRATRAGAVNSIVAEIAPGRSRSLLQLRTDVPAQLWAWSRPVAGASARGTGRTASFRIADQPGPGDWSPVGQANQAARLVHRISVPWPADGERRELLVTAGPSTDLRLARFLDVRVNQRAIETFRRAFGQGRDLDMQRAGLAELELGPFRRLDVIGDLRFCEPEVDLAYLIPRIQYRSERAVLIRKLANWPGAASVHRLIELLKADLVEPDSPGMDALHALAPIQDRPTMRQVWEILERAPHPLTGRPGIACIAGYAAADDEIHADCERVARESGRLWLTGLMAIVDARRADRRAVLDRVLETARPGDGIGLVEALAWRAEDEVWEAISSWYRKRCRDLADARWPSILSGVKTQRRAGLLEALAPRVRSGRVRPGVAPFFASAAGFAPARAPVREVIDALARDPRTSSQARLARLRNPALRPADREAVRVPPASANAAGVDTIALLAPVLDPTLDDPERLGVWASRGRTPAVRAAARLALACARTRSRRAGAVGVSARATAATTPPPTADLDALASAEIEDWIRHEPAPPPFPLTSSAAADPAQDRVSFLSVGLPEEQLLPTGLRVESGDAVELEGIWGWADGAWVGRASPRVWFSARDGIVKDHVRLLSTAVTGYGGVVPGERIVFWEGPTSEVVLQWTAVPAPPAGSVIWGILRRIPAGAAKPDEGW